MMCLHNTPSAMRTDLCDLTRSDIGINLLLVHPDRHTVHEYVTNPCRLIRRQAFRASREIGYSPNWSRGNGRWIEDDDVGPGTHTEFAAVNEMKKVGL
jgi:hypothetical protein